MLKVFLQFKMQTQRRIMTIFQSKLWLCFLMQYIVEAEVASAGSISFKSMKCDPSESELLPVIYKNEIENPISPDYKSVHGNCQVNLKFYCSAAYPVEWVEYYDRSKHIGDLLTVMDRAGKDLWTERELNKSLLHSKSWNKTPFSDILDQSDITKHYTAFLQIPPSQNSACVLTNYTCRSSQKACLQSRLIAAKRPNETTAEYTYSNVPHDEEVKEEECTTYLEAGIMDKQTLKVGWRCVTDNQITTKPKLHRCDSAMHCNGYLKHSKNKCSRRLSVKAGCERCDYTEANDYSAIVMWCEDRYGTVVAAGEYFFAVSPIETSNIKPKIYSDWMEADPQEMMLLESLPDSIYLMENRILTCYVSRYYFSYGFLFAFSYKNGSITFADPDPADGKNLGKRGVQKLSYNITFTDEALEAVYCIAPIWNSSQWVNQSSKVVNFRYDPALRFSVNESLFTVNLHQKNVTLSCVTDLDARPDPVIKWIYNKNASETQVSEVKVNEQRVDLLFKDVSHSVSGLYICEASNMLGVKQKRFTVQVQDEAADFQKAAIISVSIFALVMLALLFLCWHKVRIQKRQIRTLTDSEVNDFRRGNIDVVENSEYLDTQELLHALPYNDEYEIPSKCLYVDPTTVLGSGNFGIVLKGTLYDKHNRRNSSTVAVKTTRPKYDVNFFQTLLTEVKIMSHIGRHANIVSLLGACTENIKNRQIYIAVEFCSKGSLEMFLKGNRMTFVNLICGDTICMNTSFGNTVTNVHYNNLESSSELSTVHLLKWAREIANGMDFLGSKKIVHGDLATRNILLTDILVAKIGDFGLSRVLMKYSNYTRSSKEDCFLAFKWMAPETLLEAKFSPLSDIWSYGVTIWEIFTLGEPPYAGLSYSSGFIDWLRRGHRLHKPFYANSQIYNVMMDCWNMDSTQRMSFVDLKDFFEDLFLQATTTDYVDTKLNDANHFMNRVDAGAMRAQNNPGYMALGNALQNNDFNGSEDEYSPDYANFEGDLANDEFQGYLRPLTWNYTN